MGDEFAAERSRLQEQAARFEPERLAGAERLARRADSIVRVEGPPAAPSQRQYLDALVEAERRTGSVIDRRF